MPKETTGTATKYAPPIPLPADILDLVTDELRAETRTLKNCSLVCKEWTPRSQRCIFDVYSYCNYDPDSPTPDDLASFLSASPHIAQYIRTLALRSCNAFQLATLISIITRLPYLQNFELDQLHLLDDHGVPHSAPPRRLEPLSLFCFNECQASSAIFHYLLGLYPSISCLKLRNRTWVTRGGIDTWKLYDPSRFGPLGLAVDTLSIYNVPWEMISAMLHHISTMAKTITTLRLRTLHEYYKPTAVGSMLGKMPSLRYFQLGPYFPITMDELRADYPQGRAFKELHLDRCEILETVEFSFCLKESATEMREHLEMFMDVDLPESGREVQFSFFMLPFQWCFALPKSPEDLVAWAQLDRRMLTTPSHVRFRVVYSGKPGGEHLLKPETVATFRAFCEAVLPGVSAKGRLSVLGEALVPPGASRHCSCPSCVPAAV